MKVTIAGDEQMPRDPADRAEAKCLMDHNGVVMDQLFLKWFGLRLEDRYSGNFPYPDAETGRPKVAWVLKVGLVCTRNAIVACLRAAIRESGLTDIVVKKSERALEGSRNSPWPYMIEIIAMGDSVTDTLAGERRIQEALSFFDSWMTQLMSD